MLTSACGGNNMSQRIAYDEKLELNTFQYTDRDSLDLEYDIDPENNFSATAAAMMKINSSRLLQWTTNYQ